MSMKIDEMKPLPDIMINKTFKYLVPILKTYGNDFIYYLNNIDRVAFGIGHIGITYPQKAIFILVNVTYKIKLFEEFLINLRVKEYYIDDYIFGNAVTSIYQMIVLKILPEYEFAYNNFIIGKYSKMFNDEEINKYFKKNSLEQRVLKKEKGFEGLIVKEIDEKFGTNIISINDILDNIDKWEFSLPPLKEDECF